MPPDRHTPVLIVDDEADLRSLLVEALEDQGYAAEGAESGEAALAKIRQCHYPVIFTDLNMPGGLSGLDLIQAIRKEDPKSFPILITGYATTESAILALKSGAYDFITKPFKFAEVEASLSRALDHYRVRRENEAYQQNLEAMVEARTEEILGLKDDIERLFEGFVQASVTAIEARDPSTSGHSARVAELTVGLAEAVNATPQGAYGHVQLNAQQLRELRYASLLHDFGKVGVREQVLVKAKKLEPGRLEQLFQRQHQRGLESLLHQITHAWSSGQAYDPLYVERLLLEHQQETEFIMDLLARSNEPSVLPREVAAELDRLTELHFEHWTGVRKPLVDAPDLELLRIPKGSLSAEEREEVQSHVTHTFRFLTKIPWTRELAEVPEIAYAHHERLNGRGYPRALNGAEIPLQSKMMAIADVFDALAAKDRPYKAAVPVDRALMILEEEARINLLDANLLHIFIEAKIFELTMARIV
ncbi:MAG TPA: HD domain-containing phosphohydrolase [Holophagaceae bacterium]|nr:HD domain-containing phosphohydrolase [Holophagaceae bacterium]